MTIENLIGSVSKNVLQDAALSSSSDYWTISGSNITASFENNYLKLKINKIDGSAPGRGFYI
jgi:hypothetical protein